MKPAETQQMAGEIAYIAEEPVHTSRGAKGEKTKNLDSHVMEKINVLLRENNDKTWQPAEKGILLIGKVGSGKSTLANVLAGRELQAVFNKEEGKLVVDTVNPVTDMVIRHGKVTGTI